MKSSKLSLIVAICLSLSTTVISANRPSANISPSTDTAHKTTSVATLLPLPAGVYSDTVNHWAKTAIAAMSNAGYISGYSDHTFQPNASMTREQIACVYAAIINKEHHIDSQTPILTSAFSDVSITRWSNSAIATVCNSNIMGGYRNGTFNPERAMTRQEFAVTALNFAKLEHVKTSNKNESIQFKDQDSFTDWGKSAIMALAEKGYLAYGPDVTFNPSDPITRAEVTSILYRIITNQPVMIEKANTPTTHNVSSTVEKKDAPKSKQEMTAENKQQKDLENSVFNELSKIYKSPNKFQDYGVIYWKDNILHIAVKDTKKLSLIKTKFAAMKQVTVESSNYSQTEYNKIEKNFRKYYGSHEKSGMIIVIFPDIQNNQLYALVTTASASTQQGVDKTFASKVKMVVKTN